MEALYKIYAQLAASFRAMTPAARVAAVLSASAVLACLVYLLNQQLAPRDSYLLGGEVFSASQLSAMQSAFGKAGLEARVEGGRIKVPQGQESKYMASLAETGTLADFGGYLKQAVSSNSILSYGPQQEARTKVAIQSELQLAITRMKGIESAFVHISQETRRGFREKNIVTASVAVQPRPHHSLDEATVAAIRSLVASAWASLTPEAVTVVDLSGPRLFAGTSGEAQPTGAVGGYADSKKRLEADWQEKIARLLAPIVPGALVTTNVEFDADVSADEKLVLGDSAAAPGILRGLPSRTQTPRRVTVSVAVPSTHYEEIWRSRHASAVGAVDKRRRAAALAEIEAAEKKKIEAAIFPLLGNKDAAADASQVAVTTFDPPGATPSAEPAAAGDARVWLQANWIYVALASLILTSVLLVRSMFKPAAAAPVKRAARGAADALLADRSPPDEVMARRASERFAEHAASGPSLRDELAHAVRRHPDSAVSLLRTWIGNAS